MCFIEGGQRREGEGKCPLGFGYGLPPIMFVRKQSQIPDIASNKRFNIKISWGSTPPDPPYFATCFAHKYILAPPAPHTISFCTPLGKKLKETLVRGKIVNGTHKSNSVIPMILHFLVLASVLKVYTSRPQNNKNTLLYCTRGTRTCHIHYELLVQ